MKKEGDDENPLAHLKKSQVLHDAKCFHASPLDTRRCCTILTHMLYLLHQGEVFNSEEAMEFFFGVTKLYQSNDPTLRRLTFLGIKELAKYSDQSFIVISQLEKDVNGEIDLFKANAIRVLSSILDSTMIEQRERYFRQAIVSKDPLVQSSALVAGIRLFAKAPQVVQRWINEITENLKSDDVMVSFHALQLLYLIRQHDKRSILKVLMSLAKRPPASPYAMCLLIRYVFKLINSLNDNAPNELLECLHRSLHHKSTQVQLEAAKAICHLKNVSEKQVSPAVETLTDLLNSHIAIERFAAIRVLSSIVDKYPILVGSRAEVELEHLIGDTNRNIATLAITTMLKTGVESSVDRLFKTMENFMQSIPDELKVVLVDAIQTLCLKFPNKHETLMSFLSKALREEGGFEYKESIVNSMLILMKKIPEAQPSGLEHLCEFIEDCEYSNLVINILHVLGEIGPSIRKPARYIRFIFNRVLLELPHVRAVAVSTLTKFGESCPTLRDDIQNLIKRCIADDDDDVRDRARAAVNFLTQEEEQLQLNLKFDWQVLDLEYSLQQYLSSNRFGQGFDLSMLQIKPQAERPTKAGSESMNVSSYELEPEHGEEDVDYMRMLKSHQEFAEYGLPFQSSNAINLTEDECEYQVSVIKHIYENHVIFHFIVVNTIQEYILTDVTCDLEVDEEVLMLDEDIGIIPAEIIRADSVKHLFVPMSYDGDVIGEYIPMEIPAVLKFFPKEVTDQNISLEDLEYIENYEDEYELYQIDMELKDFIKGVTKNKKNFKAEYQNLMENERKKKFNLSLSDLQTAVTGIVEKLGLEPVENCDRIAAGEKACMLNLAGEHISGVKIYARAMLKQIATKKGKSKVTLQIGVTAEENELELQQLLISSIR